MKKGILIIILICLVTGFLFSTERTEPAVFFVAIDKSLSMEESGAFQQVQQWLTADFIPNSLMIGDRIVFYVFYGKTEPLVDITISTEADFARLSEQINNLHADGAFTDIGTAIDTVRKNVIATNFNRITSMIILTDLRQEASFTSKYAGTYLFNNRYLKEDRITTHGNDWYEVQINVPAKPEAMAKQLFSIIATAPRERDL